LCTSGTNKTIVKLIFQKAPYIKIEGG